MAEKTRTSTERIHDHLQGLADGTDPDIPPGSVLVRWCLVADWAEPSGDRTITRMVPPGVTPWERDALLGYAGWDEDDPTE